MAYTDAMQNRRHWILLATLIVAACGSVPPVAERPAASQTAPERQSTAKSNEVVLFALGLIDTGYRFGGKNPEAGLDCSGMVSYIFNQATGLKVTGNAAEIARKGLPVEKSRLRPGDLVFFNTRNAPFSHVGVYIGDDRFVHAPSSTGRVRIDRLSASYFAARFEAARSYFD
ncbi:C40 family peptidase [uncultured Propionivibrio sp.]|uniref:C40 family peptidase n=1 Tax=uncultured Propionivibrio sp. TaxID=426737 RepID=UPI0029C0A1BE|nr:C40 family peptidase [uncultured Propionivibrio sp.]